MNASSKKMEDYLFLFSFLLIVTFFSALSNGCCWLKDPIFKKDPQVLELNPNLLRVSWKDSLDNLNCVDHFHVYFWETNSVLTDSEKIESQAMNKTSSNSKMLVDINTKEDTLYTIKVNAYEDGLIDCGDNWSNHISHKTSKIVVTTLPPVSTSDIARKTESEVTTSTTTAFAVIVSLETVATSSTTTEISVTNVSDTITIESKTRTDKTEESSAIPSSAHEVKIEDKDANEINFAITILISSSGIVSCALIILLLMIFISKIQNYFEEEELKLDKDIPWNTVNGNCLVMSVDKENKTKEDINICVKFTLPNDTKSQGDSEKRETNENKKEMTKTSNSKEYLIEKEVVETQFSNILIICPKK